MRHDRAPFDSSKDFKAAVNMRYAGIAILAGTGPLDKRQADERTLKMMYDQRRIDFMSGDELAEAEAEQLEKLTDDQRARIDKLVADNDRAGLNTLATDAGVDSPEALGTKADVATAIVLAEDAPPPASAT